MDKLISPDMTESLSQFPEEKAKAAQAVVFSYIRRIVHDPVVEKQVIALYMSEYSQSEMERMLKFYKSQAGQKQLRREAIIEDRINQIYQRRMQDLLPEFVRDTTQALGLETNTAQQGQAVIEADK